MRRRIDKSKEEEKEKKLSSYFFDTKGKIIGVCLTAAIIVLITIALMIVESGYGKLIVKNKSDLKLEYVKTSFVNMNGTVASGLKTGSIDAEKNLTADIEEANLLGTDSNLEVRFKFENRDEMFTDAGKFNANFNGDIKITFEKTDDPNKIKLKIKASNGIFSTKSIDCNESFTIDLKEGQILE